MTQVVIPVGSEKLYAGIEGTYGTAATTEFVSHVAGSAKPKLSQTEIEHNAASSRLFQSFTTRQGLKSSASGVAFGVHAKPASAVLDTGATPATPYLGSLIKAILGGEYSAAGSTCAGGASTTSVPVQAGHGSRFRIGTVVAIEYSSARYFRVITGISTDTLTVWPALPGAPSSGDDVLNGYSYFLTERNAQSLTVEHTHTVSATDAATVQRRLLGCTGNLSFEVARDALASFGFDLKAADWEYGSLSLTTTVGTETMGDPVAVTQGIVYLQDAGTTTDTKYCVASLSSSFNSGMTHLLCLGGVQGTSGVGRMGGRDSAEFTLRFKADTARYTEWSAQTLLRMLALFPSGSGNSARAVSMFANRAQIVGVPVEVEDGGFLYHEVKIRPVLDTSLTVDTAAGAPYSITLV